LEIVFFTANLNSVAAGSGQPFVNQTILNDTLVPLPPSTEQSRIVAEVDRHLSIICEVESEVNANLRRAQALRQATLAKAFAL
jgi:type I restriction enzyme S subunit